MGRNINTSSNEYKNLIKEIDDLKKIVDKRDSEFKVTFLRCLSDEGFRNCIGNAIDDYNREFKDE